MGKKPKRQSLIEIPTHKHCGLCERTVKLSKSHILADHMGAWMLAHSAARQFRSANEPNRGDQDLPKIPLLCAERCEGAMKQYEDPFKAALWDPWCANVIAAQGELPDDLPLPTDPWMDVHTLSVAWRALHVHADDNRRRFELLPHTKAADEEWRRALEAGKLPKNSHFWVLQSKKMDELLRRRKHYENRAFILLKTYIGNSDSLMAWRRWMAEVHQVPVGKHVVQFEKRLYDLRPPLETSRGYYMSFVKGYGFCFLGVHTKDQAVADSLDLDEVASEMLDYALRENQRRIASKLRDPQKRKDADAHKKHEKNPTLSMQIIAADKRAKEEREKKPKG